MNKNSKAENQETMVLKTGIAGMILRWVGICLAIGVILGICVMLVLNFGWLDKETAQDPAGIVASLASNEVEAQSELDNVRGEKIDLNDLGIKFVFDPVDYDGEAHTLVARNIADDSEVTDEQLAAYGIAVTYYNNVHTDAGSYEVNAVFTDADSEDGVEYEPLSITAIMRINKAEIKGVYFNDVLVEYKKGTVHTIKVSGDLPAGTYVEYSMNKGEDAGVYYATAVIHGANYNPKTLNATLTIVDLTQLVKFDEDSYSFVYDNTEHYIALNTESVLEEIVEERNFKVEYLNNGMVNAGEYTVVATVSADGFTTFTVSVPVIVEKGDLVEVFGTSVEGNESTYDGNRREATVKNLPDGVTYTVEYSVNGVVVDEAVKPNTYKVKFTFTDTNGNLEDKVLECEIVINKLDISMLVTFEGATYTYAIYDEYETPYKRKIEATCDLESLAGMGINTDALIITYIYGDTVSTDPIEFTEAGEYVVKVHVTGDETYTVLYADVELEATLKIKHAMLTGVIVDTTQTVTANGKYQVPEYSAPEGTTVEYFISDKKVDGVKNAGIYRVKMVFTNGNYQTTKTVTMTVMLDPKIVAIFAVIGVMVGIGVGVAIAVAGKKRDEESDEKFARPSAVLTKARGKILCTSFAKYGKPAVDGRLYLTEKTVEFYNKAMTQDNRILIPLRDVRNVDVLTPDCICIRANDADHTFYVPGCQAEEWKRQIVYAKAVPVVRMPDAVPVVMVDKIPQLQPQVQVQPAADTLTTVDFQVKVKTEPGANPEVTSEVVGTETAVTSAPEAPKE